VEKGFRRDTTNQQASPTEPWLPLYQGGLQAVLAGAHGGRIATRTAAYHGYIVCHFRLKCSIGALFYSDFKAQPAFSKRRPRRGRTF
jgi:hypothetical protein